MPHLEEDLIVARASARFQRVSARKARMLANLVRNKTVAEARDILRLTHRPSAGGIIETLFKSLVANVDRTAHPDVDSLVLGEVEVGDGPTMYRLHTRARGRSARIRKRFCHISMKLIEG